MSSKQGMNSHYVALLSHVEMLWATINDKKYPRQIYEQIENSLVDFAKWDDKHKKVAQKILQNLMQYISHEDIEDMPNFACIVKEFVRPISKKSQGIVFCADNNYAAYLGVALYSMRANSSFNNSYDICILYTDLCKYKRQKIKALAQENFHIRFININAFLEDINQNIFVTHAHFSKAAYYRFFIPKIFEKYEKIIYLDCDMLILSDIDDAFRLDMQNKALAAILEYKFKCRIIFNAALLQYAKQVLKLKDVQCYFNTGFLIFDIKQLNAFQFTQKCIEKLVEVKRPRTVDQCIINCVMQDEVAYLKPSWNLQTHVDLAELKQYALSDDYNSYVYALEHVDIIHYCAPEKPWNTLSIPFAQTWWDYAKKTNFYVDILEQNPVMKKYIH